MANPEARSCECGDISHTDDGAPERLAQRYMAHTHQAKQDTAVLTDIPFLGMIYFCDECRERGHLGFE